MYVLAKIGPTWALWLTLLFCFIVPTILHMYDVRPNRGPHDDSPKGYPSSWIVPIFYWFGLPILILFTATFAQAVMNYTTPGADQYQYIWVLSSLTLATAATLLWTDLYTEPDRTTQGMNDGLVSFLKGLNVFGWYRLGLFFCAMFAMSTVIIHGAAFAAEINEPHIINGYWTLVMIAFASFGTSVTLDIMTRLGYKISPNDLLSCIAETRINF